MSKFDKENEFVYPMRIQVAPGSEAEYRHYRNAVRRSGEIFEREALAPGVSSSPQDDLIFRGGKTLPRMAFQNIYLGHSSDFAPGDVESIDDSITPYNTLSYYSRLVTRFGQPTLDSFVRFYYIPGFGHGNGFYFAQ